MAHVRYQSVRYILITHVIAANGMILFMLIMMKYRISAILNVNDNKKRGGTMKAKIIERRHTVITYTLNGKKQYIVEAKESCKNNKRKVKHIATFDIITLPQRKQ